mgnify:CR=1 FL=1
MMDFSKATIGVNTDTVDQYLTNIKDNVINEAIRTLESEQENLFEAFRRNWVGQSEINFETNMANATEEVKKSLELHYQTLREKVYAINNAWIQQDASMVERKN